MRKIVAIILLMIYSVCSTGATIYLHHCGKHTSYSIDQYSKVSHDNCPNCLKEHDNKEHTEDNSCCKDDQCKDRQIDLKSDSEQLQTKSSLQNLISFSPAIVLIPWIMEQWKEALDDNKQSNNQIVSIPIQDLEPVYLLHCNLRI